MKYYQSVTGAKVIIDPGTKVSKGYGFVKFSDLDDSQRALKEMNGKYVYGRQIKTK
jgi:nucleolar protein 4